MSAQPSHRTESPRVGVNLMATAPIAAVVDVARLAERLGCARCWVYDEGLHTRDVYVTLSAIAGATNRIGLGPGITNPYVRHPGATAAAIASLDEMSGGRAFLGLGAGGGLTLGPLAIDRVRPVSTVAEMVSVLRALWRGETVTHEGPSFALDRARLSYARPDIEIMLAGRGPRMVALGARQADGFLLSYLHKALLGPTIAALRAAREETAGDHAGRFSVVYSTMVATTEEDLESARAQLSFRLVDSPPEVKELLGMTEADTAAIRAALADGGPSRAAAEVKPEWVPHFVLVGTAEECSAELHGLMVEHGIDEFQLPVPDVEAGHELLPAFLNAFLAPG